VHVVRRRLFGDDPKAVLQAVEEEVGFCTQRDGSPGLEDAAGELADPVDQLGELVRPEPEVGRERGPLYAIR
jgi:hypothetical protein